MAISLKAARINAEMSRPDAVNKLEAESGVKISVNTLASYEYGITQPDITTAFALASLYGMSPSDIAWSRH